MERWLWVIDGIVEGHEETEQKAWRKAYIFCNSCYYQDEPYFPKIEVVREVLEDEDNEIFGKNLRPSKRISGFRNHGQCGGGYYRK